MHKQSTKAAVFGGGGEGFQDHTIWILLNTYGGNLGELLVKEQIF